MNPLFIVIPLLFGAGYMARRKIPKGAQVAIRGAVYGFDGKAWLPLGSEGIRKARENHTVGEITTLSSNGVTATYRFTGEAWVPA